MQSIESLSVPPPTQWQDFEHLCWLLWHDEWQDSSTQKNGRQGQPQCGVDVFGQPTPDYWVGVQCKGKDNFKRQGVTEKELRAEVNKALLFIPPLSEYILATTGARDARIQRVARTITVNHRKKGLFSVRVCAWDDIRDLLGRHPKVVSETYSGAAFARDIEASNQKFLNLVVATLQANSDQHKKATDIQTKTVLNAIGKFLNEMQSVQGTELLTANSNDSAQRETDKRRESTRSTARQSSKRQLPAVVLSADRIRILGLLAVTPTPFSSHNLKCVFPDVDWKTHLQYFSRHGLTECSNGKYQVPRRIQNSFLKSVADRQVYLKEWVAVLEKVSSYTDTALFLAKQQLRLGKTIESVITIVEVIEASSSRGSSETFLSILLSANHPKLLRRFSNRQRVRYMNAVAICLGHCRKFDEALRWFVSLRRFSKQVKSSWGVRQSYHNSGVSYIEMGLPLQAEKVLRKSVQYARSARDYFLLGRSLYELAMAVVERCDAEAAHLLQESERVKEGNGDELGLLGIHHGYGVLAVQRQDFSEALKRFKKAKRAAVKAQHWHAEALEQFNIGQAYYDLGKYKLALSSFRKAKQLGENQGFNDVITLVAGGVALALEKQQRHREAEAAFRSLHQIHMQERNFIKATIALHDVGVMLLRRNKYVDARKVFHSALRHARRNQMSDWVFQCQADVAKSYAAEGRSEIVISTLRRMAVNEEQRAKWTKAAELWLVVAEYGSSSTKMDGKVEEALGRALNCAGDSPEGLRIKIRVHTSAYLWHWRQQAYTAAIDDLKQMHEVAVAVNDADLVCASLNQLGVCLQELARVPEAVQLHRRALRIARGLQNPEALEQSLNNLGEALRKTNRRTEAIRRLFEAEAIATTRGDVESAIGIRLNRALAIQSQGRLDEANKLFVECREITSQRRIWYEHVRALHCLANLEWHRGNPVKAEIGYARALGAANRHEVTENLLTICLNYANALEWSNKRQDAIAVLESCEMQFQLEPDAHVYHSQLASLYADIGDPRRAKQQWHLASESASVVGNKSAIAFTQGALAELNEENGHLEHADKHYQNAILNEEDVRLRFCLLVQRLNVLLSLKRLKEASKVLEQIHLASKTKNVRADYLDALMMWGTFHWVERASDAQAMKGFVAAISTALGIGESKFFEIGGVIAAQLASGESRNRVARLKRAAEKWLRDEYKLKSDAVARFLWPLSAAVQLSQPSHAWKEVGDEQWVATVEELIDIAFEWNVQQVS